MTDQELEQAIKTVMVFDGWELRNDDPEEYSNGYYKHESKSMTLSTRPSIIRQYTYYRNSWNWIHPVWEKFRDMKKDNLYASSLGSFKKMTIDIMHREYCNKIRPHITDGTKMEAFTTLYEAITWFNSLNREQ